MGKIHSESELRKASDHIFYEVWMMNQLAEILEKGEKTEITEKYDSYTTTPVTTFVESTLVTVDSFKDVHDVEISRVKNNAIVEALAIHIRSLIDFFYTTGKDDDIVAEHFFTSAIKWTSARPPKTDDQLKKIKFRVNKEIAHLTYARLSVSSKRWPYKRICADLNKSFSVFAKLVPKKFLGRRWK